MHICIDGRSVSHPRRGGYKTYIEGLLSAFHLSGSLNHFTICYDRPYEQESFGGDSRFEEVVIQSPSRYLGQIFREHVSLALRDKSIRPDLWHFPYNTSPVRGIKNYIITIHDVTSYTHSVDFDWSRPMQATQELAYFYYPRLLIKRSALNAKLVITVSHYAKECIVKELGVPKEKVVVTPLAAHNLFRPFSSIEKGEAASYLSGRYGIERPFILTVASSLLKNPQGSMDAFSQLPANVRQHYDLIIVMAYKRFRGTILERAKEIGILSQTKVLVNVNSEDLLKLYNLAELFLYPSFTESFGLPTAEAMACGTPIICSNNTVFPELVGDAAILVHPEDISRISEQLERVLGDNELVEELKGRSLKRSSLFSWKKTADLTLEAYEAAVKL